MASNLTYSSWKSSKSASAVSFRLRKPTFLHFLIAIGMNVYVCICFCYSIPLKEMRAFNRFREGFPSVIEDSAVSMRPRKPLPQFQRDRISGFCGFNETAESGFPTRTSRRIGSHIQHGFSPWIRALRGNVWWKNQGLKISWHCPFNMFGFCGFNETAETDSAFSMRRRRAILTISDSNISENSKPYSQRL
jgi:hypothetical protein